jgi:hypothetical protein
MSPSSAEEFLNRTGFLKHSCDLDLLVFFARHPHALVTSEQLAPWLGYELSQVADSLEVLMRAGLLTRTQNPAHAARLYVLDITTGGDWFPEFLALASTRAGRLAMREALSHRASNALKTPDARVARPVGASRRPRPFVVRRSSDDRSGVKAG